VTAFDYGDSELIFEVRGLASDPYRGAAIGNVFHCTDGYLVCTSYQRAAAYRPNGELIRSFDGSADHFGNFIGAVRSRRRQDLNGEILEGHLSSALCHLANISFRLGSVVPFDRRSGIFDNNAQATDTLNRTVEHLTANRVPLDDSSLQVGRRLTIQPQTETFVNDREADALLTREYRAGFVVPARV
jgi:hypothetical protein